MNPFAFFRILIGLLFIISGAEKLISPYQNFQFVIENYQVLPMALAPWVARIFPWFELILGVFAVLGLWTTWSLRGLIVLNTIFIGVVGQAIIRHLPIDKCGCFGELISIPLPLIILMDSCLWILLAVLIANGEKTKALSLDQAL